MAIRTRILLLVVALVLAALSILDVVSFVVVRRSLISRADAQLLTAAPTFQSSLGHLLRTGQAGTLCGGLPPSSFGALYTEQGQIAAKTVCTAPNAGTTLPKLPESLITAATAQANATSCKTSTGSACFVDASVTGAGDGEAYRIAAAFIGASPGGFSRPVIFAVGEPLSPVNSTLGHVLLLELLVTGSILIAGGATAFFLVGVGLRPLEKMAVTAGEIAAGDLSRRVEDTDERTEVGQLGSSLNVMLSRIEQAFREKEMSEAQLRRFVADASHELRTPLTSIRGYAELFSNGIAARPDDLASAMRRIESESARMATLVDDLLLLARLDQGRPLEHVPVDLGLVASDAASDARVLAPERAISLVIPANCSVVGDEHRLRQAVTNLVANALSHTPAGSPVEIVLESSLDRGSVRLSVVDHGLGIGAEEHERVFDRFWRADASRHRAHGGSGLGLSIVAAVVSAHGGSVIVRDTPGGGATFVVELPAVAIPERGVALGEPASAPVTDTPGAE